MTIKSIEQRVEEIKKMSGDPESAHSAEDALMKEFISYVATDQGMADEDLDAKAALVLSTEKIAFERWCA